jgi:2-oxoglutarate decarboxylase
VATVPDQASSSIEETDFGANDWLLEEMYEQYSADPSSVDESWAEYFAAHGSPTGEISAGSSGNGNVQGKAAPAAPAPKPAAAPAATGAAAPGTGRRARSGGEARTDGRASRPDQGGPTRQPG